jgi:hypothetical protein
MLSAACGKNIFKKQAKEQQVHPYPWPAALLAPIDKVIKR